MNSAANPLLAYTFEVPFDAIRAEHVEPAVDLLLARSKERLAKLRASSERTYASTLGVLDAATEELEHAMAVVGHLEATATTPALREAYNAVQPKVSEFYAGLSLDGELYRVLKEFSQTEEAKALDPARARFLKQTLEDFRRNGAELSPDAKSKVEKLSVDLSKLTTQYSQNLLDATNAFEVLVTDEARLGGLPESAREAARESASAKGQQGWRFTLQQPSYVAVLTYADDRALREQLYRAYNARASAPPYDNRPLIAKILELRKEKARLLGFKNFADLTLQDRMAKDGERAQQFITQLREATRPFYEKENQALLDFRNEVEARGFPERERDTELSTLQPWDISYYSEKLRKQRYDFDQEALRPYFSVDGVLDGMFMLVSRLYGVKVERRTHVPSYHKDVRYYSVLDEQGSEIGAFYADLYPRDDKRGGAWMGDFITGLPGGNHGKHLGVMCANATPPSGGKPALLTHQDVETLFHEFGHLLHHLMGRAEVRSLAGTRVAWDFVELPSMIMENFCWERSVLDFFARHYETNQPIPDALLAKLQKTRTFRAANMQMRQLGLAGVDLALHIDYDAARDGDVMEYARKFAQEHTPAPLPDEFAMIAGFGHLFASPVGYAAGYYSYKWAEVLEADAFSRFADAGVLSREVGAAFIASVLSRGNEADPMELYKTFMGREPSQAALMKRAGLVAA
jgi:oligopeptidase A